VGSKIKVCCPFHGERTPSCNVDIEDGFFKCFGCDAKGDALKLLAGIMGKSSDRDFPEVLDRAAELLGIHVDTRKESAPKVVNVGPPPPLDVFAERYGLTRADFERAGFRLPVEQYFPKPIEKTLTAVEYPVSLPDGARVLKYKSMGRNEKDKRCVHVSQKTTGNAGLIGNLDPDAVSGAVLVLAGGEEKVLAARKAGFAAVCPQDGEQALSPGQCSMLIDVEPSEIVIAYDADDHGDKGTIGAAMALYEAGARRVSKVCWPEDFTSGKDLNDYLVARGLESLRRLLASATYIDPADLGLGPESDSPDDSTDPAFEEQLPSFPLECLPSWLSHYVREVAAAIEVPLELAVTAALSVVSAAIDGRLRVKVHEQYTVTANIFAACVLPPSERKSPVVSEVTRPLIEFQTKMRTEHADRAARAKLDISLAKKRLTIVQRAAANGDKDATAEAEELSGKIVELAQLQDAVAPRILFGDVTPEQLAKDLKNNNEHGAIIESEADVLQNFFGRYSKSGSNLQLLLKSYNGEYHSQARVSQPEPIILVHPILTLYVTPQPLFLTTLPAAEAHGRGVLGRFLWSMPKPAVGDRPCELRQVNQGVRGIYRERVKAICEAPRPKEQFVLALSPEDVKTLKAFDQEMEPRLKPGKGDLGGMFGDWGGKMGGKVLKLAGLLHVAGRANWSWWEDTNLDSRALDDAIKIMRGWAIAHARAVYRLMKLEEKNAEGDAATLLAWLRARPSATTPMKDIQKRFWRQFPAGALEALIATLEKDGKLFKTQAKSRGAGRPAVVVTLKWWRGSAARAVEEPEASDRADLAAPEPAAHSSVAPAPSPSSSAPWD